MINQSLAIGVAISAVFGNDTDAGLSTGTIDNAILMENGSDFILMESGEYILKE